jgi:hypothetical protein
MKRSVIQEQNRICIIIADFASLHPGYGLLDSFSWE